MLLKIKESDRKIWHGVYKKKCNVEVIGKIVNSIEKNIDNIHVEYFKIKPTHDTRRMPEENEYKTTDLKNCNGAVLKKGSNRFFALYEDMLHGIGFIINQDFLDNNEFDKILKILINNNAKLFLPYFALIRYHVLRLVLFIPTIIIYYYSITYLMDELYKNGYSVDFLGLINFATFPLIFFPILYLLYEKKKLLRNEYNRVKNIVVKE